MNSLKNFTPNDYAVFEGQEVKSVRPLADSESGKITHFQLAVDQDEGALTLRKFNVEEISHLIECEKLIIVKNYYSAEQETARHFHGEKTFAGLPKHRRDKIDAISHLATRIEYYRSKGLKLTPHGIAEFRHLLADDYNIYQAKVTYGTDKPNSTQRLRPLPKTQTLLKYSRDFRKSSGNPLAIDRKSRHPPRVSDQIYSDKNFILSLLTNYADAQSPSQTEIAEKTIVAINKENQRRKDAGWDQTIPVKSVRTYVRWIKKYLSPFETAMQREGLAAAKRQCSITEISQAETVPGYKVIYDAWQIHISTLDTTRAKWLAMNVDERTAVKRVRRWVIVAIDSATRCILGFSICSAPNQQSTLEAMRSCYMDKTYLLRNAGISSGSWNFLVRHAQTVVDNGSEFGRHPFGGSRFNEAIRVIGGSLMNTTAGVSELRAQVERWFATADLKFARKIPGWTTGSASTLGDRKPATNACLTDDDLQDAFVGFVAEYHATKHRGLCDRPPAAVWAEKSELPQFDETTPGPSELRQACGFYVEVSISDRGIRFASNSYSNELIRKQRMAPRVERIDKNVCKFEAMIDPFDLGGITIFDDGKPITVPCTNPEMRGKSLREWNSQRHLEQVRAKQDCQDYNDQRRDANDAWTEGVARAARIADVGMGGYTQREINRAALELTFGKGLHEEPYVGRDEYVDPLEMSYIGETQDYPELSHLDIGSDEPDMIDAPSSMDRFRKSIRPITNRENK